MTYYPTITSLRISKGYGYAVSGYAGSNDGSNITDKYDDVANTWTLKMNLNQARQSAYSFSLNSYGYIAGGQSDAVATNLSSTEKYNDILNTWTTKADLISGTKSGIGFSLNGFGYIVGGFLGPAQKLTNKYDDVLNTWTAKSNLVTANYIMAGFSLSGYGYYAGGYGGAANITEKYDDIANSWTTKAILNTAKTGNAGFSLNGFGYETGGSSGGSDSAVTEKYDDILNTWTTKANLNSSCNNNAGFSLNGFGYSTVTTKTEKYDDVLNTWTAKANLTTSRSFLVGFSLGNLQQSIQNPDIQEIIKANRRLRANEVMVTKAASANTRNTHNTETTTISATYTKKKTITFNLGLIGGYRVLFDLKTSDIAKTAYGRVYRNGVALGTEQTEAGLAYATKSEDLTTSLSPGDTLELWLHNDGAGTTSAQNFQIAYDDSPTVAVQVVNS